MHTRPFQVDRTTHRLQRRKKLKLASERSDSPCVLFPIKESVEIPHVQPDALLRDSLPVQIPKNQDLMIDAHGNELARTDAGSKDSRIIQAMRLHADGGPQDALVEFNPDDRARIPTTMPEYTHVTQRNPKTTFLASAGTIFHIPRKPLTVNGFSIQRGFEMTHA